MSWKLKDLEASLLIGSTLVEGSTLSEKEAGQVLAGKTVQGHPIQEIRELLNYRSAVEWLMKECDRSPYLSKDLILGFHARLFQGFLGKHGVWKEHSNYTYLSDGNRHDYVSPGKVEGSMRRWVKDFNSTQTVKNSKEIANRVAQLYYEFQHTHPFEDGNGRIGRILIAYWLHWKGGRALLFKLSDKIEHLKALEIANRGDLSFLVDFFFQRISKDRK